MTNQERITSHNNRLEAMKETVAGLPDAGSGGGGSVETCTVTVNTTRGGSANARIIGYSYISLENGNLISGYRTYLFDDSNYEQTHTFNDVVCGSSILVAINGITSFWLSSGNGIDVSISKGWGSSAYAIGIITVPSLPGSVNSVTFDYDD